MEKSLIEMKERGAPFEFVSIGKIVGVLLLFCLLPPVVYSQQNISGKFTHGIASGDPDQFSVVLWTRFVPAKEEMNELSYEVSESRDFSQIKASGKVKSLGENNFCIKLIARELKPGTTYFYRFLQGDLISPIGRTKTLPLEVEKLRIGVVNCAKYTGGYYHAYDALAKLEDVDVVIHLGDYIYENGPSTPKSSYWAAYLATGRQHDPPRECLTLEDYRTRYAQYRSDSSLQKLHANFPMIPIWDDHEIAMKRHKQNGEGRKVPNPTWEKRRDNSIKAYHEWLPLRPEPFEEIYRSFQFGNLLNLLMLDTRVCCRSLVDKT
ncbi:MAG: alkaline phosphatase D family protein, partial [Bacteroidota bacterium]